MTGFEVLLASKDSFSGGYAPFEPTAWNIACWLFLLGTSVWATIDAKKIGLKKYKVYALKSPSHVFASCILLWIIYFPWYLILRADIKLGKVKLKEPPDMAGGSEKTGSWGSSDWSNAENLKAEKKKQKHIAAYFNRGQTCAENGEYEEAAKQFGLILIMEPNPKEPRLAKVYLNRGNAYAKSGEYENAIDDFTKAIALKPSDADAYFKRACANSQKYFESREEAYRKQAKADIRKAISLDAKYSEWVRKDRDFDPIRGDAEFIKLIGG